MRNCEVVNPINLNKMCVSIISRWFCSHAIILLFTQWITGPPQEPTGLHGNPAWVGLGVGEKIARSSGCVCHGVSHQVDAPAKTFLGWHLPRWGDDRRSRGVILFTYLPFSSWNSPPRNKDWFAFAAATVGTEISSVTPSCGLFFFIQLFTNFREIFLVF